MSPTCKRTSAIWFGFALALMPQPGGTVDDAIGDFYAGTVGGVPVPLLLVIAGMAILVLLLRHRLGRQILAVGSNAAAARSVPGGKPQATQLPRTRPSQMAASSFSNPGRVVPPPDLPRSSSTT